MDRMCKLWLFCTLLQFHPYVHSCSVYDAIGYMSISHSVYVCSKAHVIYVYFYDTAYCHNSVYLVQQNDMKVKPSRNNIKKTGLIVIYK